MTTAVAGTTSAFCSTNSSSLVVTNSPAQSRRFGFGNDAFNSTVPVVVSTALSMKKSEPCSGCVNATSCDEATTGRGPAGDAPGDVPGGPPLFDWLQKTGRIAEAEMHRVFNCGIGMVVVVAAEHAARAMHVLQREGETVFVIGEIRARRGDEARTVVA